MHERQITFDTLLEITNSAFTSEPLSRLHGDVRNNGMLGVSESGIIYLQIILRKRKHERNEVELVVSNGLQHE